MPGRIDHDVVWIGEEIRPGGASEWRQNSRGHVEERPGELARNERPNEQNDHVQEARAPVCNPEQDVSRETDQHLPESQIEEMRIRQSGFDRPSQLPRDRAGEAGDESQGRESRQRVTTARLWGQDGSIGLFLTGGRRADRLA